MASPFREKRAMPVIGRYDAASIYFIYNYFLNLDPSLGGPSERCLHLQHSAPWKSHATAGKDCIARPRNDAGKRKGRERERERERRTTQILLIYGLN